LEEVGDYNWGLRRQLLIRPSLGDELHVHGVEVLCVVDPSVDAGTNINAPSIMIAEKAAAMVKDARQKLAAEH
jgi:choline dehydrogenase-like flavoprotein